MQWLMDYISRRKNKKTKIYKAAELADGETRDIMLAKQDAPINERGVTAAMMIEHWRTYGQFDKLEAGYAEPSQSAEALCAGCMFFIRAPWGESDTCQIVTGNIVWYGTCKLRIDANEQSKIVYAEEIGEYAAKAEDVKVVAPAAKAAKVKKQFRVVVTPMDEFVGGTFVAKSLGDGVTEISGRLSSGAQAVYAYTLGDGWTAERAAEYVAKSAAAAEVTEEESVSFEVPITKRDEAKRIVYGVVLQPDVEDLHGDIVSAEEIEKACHTYTAYCRKVNDQHADAIRADVVENYIAPVDFAADNGVVVKKGSWVQGTKIFDDAMWLAIQSGERTGYSYEGWARRTQVA